MDRRFVLRVRLYRRRIVHRWPQINTDERNFAQEDSSGYLTLSGPWVGNTSNIGQVRSPPKGIIRRSFAWSIASLRAQFFICGYLCHLRTISLLRRPSGRSIWFFSVLSEPSAVPSLPRKQWTTESSEGSETIARTIRRSIPPTGLGYPTAPNG